MKNRIAGIIVAAALSLSIGLHATEKQSTNDDFIVTYMPGHFSDFIIEPDGSVLLIPSYSFNKALAWRNGEWKEVPEITWEGAMSDVASLESGRWAVATMLSATESALYEYSSGKLKMIGIIPGTHGLPTLHRAPDGTVWVASQSDAVYMLKNGIISKHEFWPESKELGGQKRVSHSPPLSFTTSSGELWFWPFEIFNNMNSALSFERFHVYKNGAWRVFPYPGGNIGDVILEKNNNSILACNRNGREMTRIDLRSGAYSSVAIPFAAQEGCYYLREVAQGGLLMLSPIHRRNSGSLAKLLSIKGGRALTLLDQVNYEPSLNQHIERPAIDIPEGVLISESKTGLIFVSSDLATAKRIEWKHDFSLSNITRMKKLGKFVCALDRSRGFMIFDPQKLVNVKENPSMNRWTVMTSLGSPAFSPDGTLWSVSSVSPPAILQLSGTEQKPVSIEGSGFERQPFSYIAADTKNRLWLIGSARASFLDHGRWRFFNELATAYSTVAAEEKGNKNFRIGNGRNQYYPAFAGDGRVAYQNQDGSINIYDGAKWHINSQKELIENNRPEGPPFYYDGAVTVRAGGFYYQRLGGEWKRIYAIIQSPYGESPRQNYVSKMPANFPGKPYDSSFRLQDNVGAFWGGGIDEIWRSVNGIWAPLNIRSSPLTKTAIINEIILDKSGCIWFYLPEMRDNLIRYQPQNPLPRIDWIQLPESETKIDHFKLGIKSIRTSGKYFLCQQLDNGEWQHFSTESMVNELAWDNLSNGVHALRVQALDELLRPSNLLEHRITVKRNYEQEVKDLMVLLKSGNYSDREKAAKGLTSIGLLVLPALKAAEKDAPDDVKWWMRAITEDIERNERTSKKGGE